MYKVREIAYHAFISNSVQLKTMPTKEKFMPLDKEVRKRGGVSDTAKSNFLNEFKKWKELSSKSGQTLATSKKD